MTTIKMTHSLYSVSPRAGEEPPEGGASPEGCPFPTLCPFNWGYPGRSLLLQLGRPNCQDFHRMWYQSGGERLPLAQRCQDSRHYPTLLNRVYNRLRRRGGTWLATAASWCLMGGDQPRNRCTSCLEVVE